MNNKTAILIFANSARFEAQQKPFQSSEVLFNALNAHTIKIAKKTGLPYFLSSETNQIGSTFAERFTNAIQAVYNQGFTSVISIGNDTPHLRSEHILKAAHRLQDKAIVLGPSKDGGFYLMGFQQSYFNSETFLALPWQTSGLRQSFSRAMASQQLDVLYLEQLSDIDTISDIQPILESFRRLSASLKQLLQHYISVVKKRINSFFIAVESPLQTLQFNKGSPQLLHL
ncbi:DUF2064 domain-containing protein [Psychroserpens sp. SPM9]|uniref:TIGR04282 family arsenosugar biosynthesis glycosyltransferase n=1 Tax=Psychroserpens sp. SPM9 TaxID=2975598 RepID=UPI0021A6330B|nr:DUF2064 domain-containing protein [Psychroserpens sp. SPM9]MDG5490237.1 DUF2064 domain-containing protein [Psychroserpens sp. SPM9]